MTKKVPFDDQIFDVYLAQSRGVITRFEEEIGYAYNAATIRITEDITAAHRKFSLNEVKRIQKILGVGTLVVRAKISDVEIIAETHHGL